MENVIERYQKGVQSGFLKEMPAMHVIEKLHNNSASGTVTSLTVTSLTGSFAIRLACDFEGTYDDKKSWWLSYGPGLPQPPDDILRAFLASGARPAYGRVPCYRLYLCTRSFCRAWPDDLIVLGAGCAARTGPAMTPSEGTIEQYVHGSVTRGLVSVSIVSGPSIALETAEDRYYWGVDSSLLSFVQKRLIDDIHESVLSRGLCPIDLLHYSLET